MINPSIDINIAMTLCIYIHDKPVAFSPCDTRRQVNSAHITSTFDNHFEEGTMNTKNYYSSHAGSIITINPLA